MENPRSLSVLTLWYVPLTKYSWLSFISLNGLLVWVTLINCGNSPSAVSFVFPRLGVDISEIKYSRFGSRLEQSQALSILTDAHSNRYMRQDGEHSSRLWEIQV